MVRTAELEYPLGTIDSATAVAGSVGLDMFVISEKPLDFVEEGGKYPVSSYDEVEKIINDYGIQRLEGRTFPGNSTANFAVAESRLLGPGEGEVILFTALAPNIPSTSIIENSLAAQPKPILLRETRFDPTDDFPHPVNAFAMIHQTENDRQIVSFKPKYAPPIQFNLRDGDPNPGVLVMGAPAGDWEHTVANGLAFAQDIPIVVFASESQINQLDDPMKWQAFYGGPDVEHQGLINAATAFVGNDVEAAKVVAAAKKKPSGNAADLAKQLKDISNGALQIVSVSQAEKGATVVDQFNNTHTLEVTDLSGPIGSGRRERKRKAFRLGAGDAFGATVVYGIRSVGATGDGIHWTMLKAGENAARVMRQPDAQTGLMNHDQFYKPAQRGMRYRMTSARSGSFPPPPRRQPNGAASA